MRPSTSLLSMALLLFAACAGPSAPAASGAERSLPLGPSVASVRGAVDEVAEALAACGPGQPVEVELLFRGEDGALEEMRLPPDLAPSRAACLRSALRPVRVPRFADTRYRMSVTLER